MANLLQGGKKRRRTRKWLVAVAIVVAPLALAGVAWLALHGKDEHSGPSVPLATHTPRHQRRPAKPTHQPQPVPVIHMGTADAFRFRFHKPPRAAMLVDLDNGNVLWRFHPYRTLPNASLTKIMTALLVTERGAPDDPVRITQAALNYQGTGLGVLKRGKRVRLETLLNGLLLVSGNDAAIALAVDVAGSQRRFVQLMNRRARVWGLRCTHYVDSHGLSRQDRSCPHDLAVLARLAMTNHRITRIIRRPHVTFPFPVKGGHIVMYGHNPLIEAHYRGAIGLKTGFTDAAGHCLVGVARRHGHTLAVVLLNSPNPLKQSAKLLRAGFAHSGA
jgi:serine-type D-Ala-D-Ala carboxypeptidase (penicillin-binding protein 5/6)